MAIIRGERPQDAFTQLRNDVLRDGRLSYRARGVLAVILSHSDGWSTSAEALQRAGSEGRDAIRTALSELEDHGYLVREKRQDSSGRWSTSQVIYDRPQNDGQAALFAPTTDFQASVFQPSVNQPSVSQASIEDHQEDSSPNGEERADEAKPVPPANQVATAVYDHAQGMVNFMAIRQVAMRALKVKDVTVERVTRAMIQLYDAGRPITFQTVGQALQRGTFKETNGEHWANGGEF